MLKVVGRMPTPERPKKDMRFRCLRRYHEFRSGYVFITGEYPTLETGKWYAYTYNAQTFYGPFPCREAARTAAKLLAS